MRKATSKATVNGHHTIAMFEQLKREQIDNVKVLIKAMPKMIAARTEEMSIRERRKLEDKIEHCKDCVRFCYFLYTDAVKLLGPKPKWLMAQ